MTLLTNTKYELHHGHRFRHALEHAGLGVQDIADKLEINRNTVGNWINGRTMPHGRDLRAFARITGFSAEWLLTGEVPSPGDDGTSDVRPERLELPTF